MTTHADESARAARKAHARMMRDPFTRLFLYFSPMRLEAFPINEAPTGWTLAFPEHIPGDRTADALVQWFAERTGRIPYRIQVL